MEPLASAARTPPLICAIVPPERLASQRSRARYRGVL